ncbi:MAG: cytochrome b [Rhodospirillales bacterium]|jgi:cytochrome b561|nr:cytochrome b [Rhodospirillales bacterium]
MISVGARTDDTTAHYNIVARLFHWTTAVLVLLLIPIGWVMTQLDRGLTQDILFVTHESIGLTILGLTAARIAWRLSHPAPPRSRALSPLEVRASSIVHTVLYLLLVALPISGYIMVAAGGFPLTYFELAEVPKLLAKDEPLSKLAETAHLTLQFGVSLCIALHIGAALHHRFLRHNDVMARMLPRLRQSIW